MNPEYITAFLIMILFVVIPIVGISIVFCRFFRHIWVNRRSQRVLFSKVSGHEGLCIPTWVNSSQIDLRTSGLLTGFFKNVYKNRFGMIVKYGEEFHGHIRNGKVYTTEGIYS